MAGGSRTCARAGARFGAGPLTRSTGVRGDHGAGSERGVPSARRVDEAAAVAPQRGMTMGSTGAAAVAARSAFADQVAAKGHAVDNARAAWAGLEAAFAAGVLQRTPALDAMLHDLAAALDADVAAGQRLGGKSAEAARFILRAIGRELADA